MVPKTVYLYHLWYIRMNIFLNRPPHKFSGLKLGNSLRYEYQSNGVHSGAISRTPRQLQLIHVRNQSCRESDSGTSHPTPCAYRRATQVVNIIVMYGNSLFIGETYKIQCKIIAVKGLSVQNLHKSPSYFCRITGMLIFGLKAKENMPNYRLRDRQTE